jgi:hypothetical protein
MPIPFGIIVWTPDEQALATERVRYIGDAVAAVAAATRTRQPRARPHPRGVRGAGGDPRPLRVRAPHRRADPRGQEGGHNGNISKIVKLEFGEVESGLAESDV